MANRYWVGGTAAWDGTAGTKWALTSGGAGGQAVPTTADDVFFDAASGASTVTISTGNTGAKSIDCTGFTGTITGTATITVAGSITLVAGMTFTHNGTKTITGTGTITSAGKSFGPLAVNGSGITVTLNGNLSTSGNNFTLTQGTFDTANFDIAVGSGSFISTGSLTRTLNLGSSTLSVSGIGTAVTFSGTNFTLNAGTSLFTFSGGAQTFNGGGFTFNNVSFTSAVSTNHIINDPNTFNNLTFAAPGSNGLTTVSFFANQTISGTLTCAGATAIRRLFLRSDTLGTARTLTVATLSAQDCDFRDITIAGAAAGGSPTRAGDCGGNSGITFTSKTVYWNLAGTQNWSSTAWALTNNGSPALNNFPLPQDTATFTDSGSAGTVTIQSFNVGAVDASGRTSAITLSYSNSCNYYGSHTWGSGVTVSGTSTQTFTNRGTATFTSAGKATTFPITVDCGPGTFQLGDTFNSSNTFTVTSGTFNTVNNTITCNDFSSAVTNTRTITLGTSTINLSGTGTIWNFGTITNLTFSGASSTINITSTSASSRTFTGGTGLIYGTLNIGGSTGASTTTINGASIFTTLSSIKTVAHTISFGTGCTINNWTVTGTAGNVVTVNSSTAGTQRTITYNGSQINIDYMSFTDINMSYTLGASNPYLVYAGANSTNGGNNLGIAFIDGTTKKAYRLTTGTTWTVPSDWNSSSNNIYLIGAGGGGASAAVSGNNRAAGGGGGGGGYRAITNFSTTAGSTITYAIGTSAGNADGGNTTWNSGATVAGGGLKGTAATTPTSAGGAGGTGDFAGGTGGAGAFGTTASQGYGAGAGGGAGGPNGAGGNGGNGFGSTTTANIAGGGGGGNGGGTNGANATSAQGGNGGNNFAGVGGGAGSATGSGTAGTVGGGGGGATNLGNGGAGGAGIDIQNTLGSGGGGGGNANGSGGVSSGLYGGGGAGGRVATNGAITGGQAGSQGVIFIVYTPSTAVTTGNFFFMFG